MGGADPDNHTLAIFRKALQFPFESYTIIIGEGYPHKTNLADGIESSGKNIKVFQNINAEEMASIMKECPVAICSASGISYEYLSIGGELYVLQTAGNQRYLYDHLVRDGLAFPFSNFRASKDDTIRSLNRQREVFDGQSGKRLRNIFTSLDFEFNVSIRGALECDMITLYDWANESELRSLSYNSQAISWDDHKEWFHKKLSDLNCHLFIFEFRRFPVAMARFDVQKNETTISYSVDINFRARGWGRLILQKAMDVFLQDLRRPVKIVGYVKHDNLSSNIIFQKLGFMQLPTDEYPNSYKYQL